MIVCRRESGIVDTLTIGYRRMKKYLIQLDGLRFLAVAAVMFGHWTQHIPSLTKFDKFIASGGVNLFFVLSGFLISKILMTEKSKGESPLFLLKSFYIRRFLRIVPLYYAVLFAGVTFSIPETKHFLLYLVSYTSNFAGGLTRGGLGAMTHLWSLGVEEQFYFFYPMALLLIPVKHLLKFYWLLVVAAVFFRGSAFMMIHDKTMAWWVAYMFTPGCIDCFAIGSILAYYSLFRKERLAKLLSQKMVFYSFLLLSAAVFGVEVMVPNNMFSMMFLRLTMAIFFFWVIGTAALNGHRGNFGKLLSARPIVYLGKISYGIYVFHHFMPWVFQHVHVPFQQVFYFPATVLIAVISWHMFELPINRLKKYFQYSRPVKKPADYGFVQRPRIPAALPGFRIHSFD